MSTIASPFEFTPRVRMPRLPLPPPDGRGLVRRDAPTAVAADVAVDRDRRMAPTPRAAVMTTICTGGALTAASLGALGWGGRTGDGAAAAIPVVALIGMGADAPTTAPRRSDRSAPGSARGSWSPRSHSSGGVVSTLSDLAIWYDALLRGDAVLPDDMQHELLYGGMAYSRGTGLGSWRRSPCDPATTADPEPFLYAFHDGGDVRVVYVPSRGVVMAMRFSRPLYDERRLADGLDDFVFAAADLDGEPVVASAGDEG